MHCFSRAFGKCALTLVSLTISLFTYSQNPTFTWAKSMGGTSSDQSRGITLDAAGNIYTVGYFNDVCNFLGTSATSAGSSDVFLTKQDASGNLLWVKTWGGAGADLGYGLALDGQGNIYVGGYFQQTVDFDPGTGTTSFTASGNDAYISKFDVSGNFKWAKAFGGTGSDLVFAIAANASNVYVTGSFGTTVDLDPGTGVTSVTVTGGSTDIFVSKFDASGNFTWGRQLGGTNEEQGLAIAVDGSGNVYTTGTFQATVDFDPGTGAANLTATGTTYGDVYVSKLNASGNYVWAKSWGGVDTDRGNGIKVDASGNVYVTGNFQNATDFDPGAGTTNITSQGLTDVFISKLDVSGSLLWVKTWGGTSSDNGQGITVDGGGNIYVTGGFMSANVDFDPGTGTTSSSSAGGFDVFLSKLDASGNFKWVQTWGSTNNDVGYASAIATKTVYVTGTYAGTVDFDPGTGTTNITYQGTGTVLDLFISKFMDPTALPLSWLSVNGRLGNEQQAIIAWSVEEVSVAQYSVEKSIDGTTFSSIGTVDGKGDGKHSYSFGESIALTASAWYRIKQIDQNGHYTYSDVVRVNAAEKSASVKIYPIPVTGQFTIQVSSNKYLNTKATLYDAGGRIQKVIVISDYNTIVDATALPHGLYTLQLVDGYTIKITR